MASMRLMERSRDVGPTVDDHLSVGHPEDRPPLLLWSSVSRRTGLLLCVLGVLAATASVLAARNGPSHPSRPTAPMMWTATDPSTVRTSGPAQLSVENMIYAPGQTSGWHSHPGLHLVTVISGTLTVYGPDCQPEHYGPGEPYIGGDTVHLARNEGEVPVEMGVTWLTMPGQSMTDFRAPHPGPTTCPVQ